MKQKISFPRIAVALTLIALLCTMSRTAQVAELHQQSSTEPLPTSDWTISAHPDFRLGFETVPVYLYSVTTDVRSGLSITKVGLWNRSSKPVAAVKLQWTMTTEEDQNTAILQGETQHIYFEKTLRERSVKEIRPPIPSFVQLSRSLSASSAGRLDGNYRLDIAVSEINFEDGSTWTRNNPVIRKVGLFQLPPGDCGQRRCQRQQCFFDDKRGSYICKDSTTCENCRRDTAFTCTNSSCLGPLPD